MGVTSNLTYGAGERRPAGARAQASVLPLDQRRDLGEGTGPLPPRAPHPHMHPETETAGLTPAPPAEANWGEGAGGRTERERERDHWGRRGHVRSGRGASAFGELPELSGMGYFSHQKKYF